MLPSVCCREEDGPDCGIEGQVRLPSFLFHVGRILQRVVPSYSSSFLFQPVSYTEVATGSRRLHC